MLKLNQLAVLAITFFVSACTSSQQGNARGPIVESPYNIVPLWADPFAKSGYAFGGNSGVIAESPDRIIIVQRGETALPHPAPEDFLGFAGHLGLNVLLDTEYRTWNNCLFVVNADGEPIEVWDHLDYLCEGSSGPGPHRIRINPYDPEKRIWLVNETFHQIYVIANDGSEVLAVYGEKNVSGTDGKHFGRPQDIAFMEDGRILIADGLDNNRIMIMDSEMNYLGEFGSEGEGPGQTKTIHSVAVGPEGRVFVLDRSGNRVNLWQATDDPVEFEFVRSIGKLALPLDIIVNEDDFWITDINPLRFVNYDFEGKRKYTWIVPRELPDGFFEVHSFSVDSDGNLYGGDNQYGRTQKLVPKPDADPELLINPAWRAK